MSTDSRTTPGGSVQCSAWLRRRFAHRHRRADAGSAHEHGGRPRWGSVGRSTAPRTGGADRRRARTRTVRLPPERTRHEYDRGYADRQEQRLAGGL